MDTYVLVSLVSKLKCILYHFIFILNKTFQIYQNSYDNFSEIESDEEDFETSSPNKLSGARSDGANRNDVRQDHSTIADTEHFSTFTFGDPSTSGGPAPPPTTDGGSGKVYDKYYDYYFKYYTDKYGGGTSLPETKSKVEEKSATKNISTTDSNFGRNSVLDKPSSLSLVTYSGSEDDE